MSPKIPKTLKCKFLGTGKLWITPLELQAYMRLISQMNSSLDQSSTLYGGLGRFKVVFYELNTSSSMRHIKGLERFVPCPHITWIEQNV